MIKTPLQFNTTSARAHLTKPDVLSPLLFCYDSTNGATGVENCAIQVTRRKLLTYVYVQIM
ncbi:hypothetical protein ANRL1_01091 [Anaerolineae bacterium]|nr:hypothetical protein ANRL1_01091 [Anaerolineae bacterium]